AQNSSSYHYGFQRLISDAYKTGDEKWESDKTRFASSVSVSEILEGPPKPTEAQVENWCKPYPYFGMEVRWRWNGSAVTVDTERSAKIDTATKQFFKTGVAEDIQIGRSALLYRE